ncbi:MAG TPA: CRTAC1 family protein, partial [Candidatus Methylomirabilis sp.]|nr:CRTAC1 family protein [Candidatus Methylomirabilis sp.]
MFLRPRAAPRLPEDPAEAITSSLSRGLPKDLPPLRFTDATEASGIRFVHSRGVRSRLLPEDMGSGAAWGD